MELRAVAALVQWEEPEEVVLMVEMESV
jgi:hypothetical protein